MNPETLAALAAAIIAEAKEWTLSKGEALYCDRQGRVWVGRDGCQPSNACFIVNHEDSENECFNWSQVEDSILAWLFDEKEEKERWENQSTWSQVASNQSENQQ
jgi:hypothetical protein